MDPFRGLVFVGCLVCTFRNRAIQAGTVLFGEIGLTGEIRHISQAEKRIAEAERMGMERVILPYSNAGGSKTQAEICGVKTLHDALAAVFE